MIRIAARDARPRRRTPRTRTSHPHSSTARAPASASGARSTIPVLALLALGTLAAAGEPPLAPAIELQVGAVRPGEELRGVVRGLAPGTYTLEWHDRWGVLDRTELAGPGEKPFSLLVSFPRAAENELALAPAGENGRLARISFRVDLPPAGRRGYLRVLAPTGEDMPPDFPAEAVLWRPKGRSGRPAPAGYALVVDIGLEELLAGPATGDMPLISARGAGASCLSDPALREAARERIREALASTELARAACVSLGTGLSASREGLAGETHLSEGCVSAFREYLRTGYETLAALSAAWGAPFSDWEEAASFALAGPAFSPQASLSEVNRFGGAALSDYLSFRHAAFASFVGFAAEEARKLAPLQPVGFSASRGALAGADLEGLASVVDWRGGEWGPGERLLAASKAAHGARLAGWAGPDPARALLAAFGGELIQLFRPSERASAEACGVLSGALGRLLELSSPPRARPARVAGRGGVSPASGSSRSVALVYSRPSVQVSALLDGLAPGPAGSGPRGPGSWTRVWEAWYSLLGDLGVPFECLTDGDLERGELASGGFAAAILPRMLAVGRSSARELERFVSSGGIVVADVAPGLFDGSLRRAGSGVLKDLFGVEHGEAVRFSEVGSTRVQIADKTFSFVAPEEGPSWFPRVLSPGAGPAESALALAGARAEGLFGALPCLVVNRFGGGWAVTLNLALSAYPELRARGGGDGLRELLRAALTRAGVRPVVELRQIAQAGPSQNLSSGAAESERAPPVADWRELGPARLVAVARPGLGARVTGLAREPSPEKRSTATMRARLRVGTEPSVAAYDSLAGSFIGWTNEFEVELAPGESRIYAFLPYRLSGVLLEPREPPARARAGVEAFEIVLRKEGGEAFVPHVISVEVEGPDGRVREELGCLVEIAGGRAGFVVPFAASDPRGLWRVRARDAATGVVSVRRFAR